MTAKAMALVVAADRSISSIVLNALLNGLIDIIRNLESPQLLASQGTGGYLINLLTRQLSAHNFCLLLLLHTLPCQPASPVHPLMQHAQDKMQHPLTRRHGLLTRSPRRAHLAYS